MKKRMLDGDCDEIYRFSVPVINKIITEIQKHLTCVLKYFQHLTYRFSFTIVQHESSL